MTLPFLPLHRSMGFKLAMMVGVVLLAAMSVWAYLNISHQKKGLMEDILDNTDRLTVTLRQGTHYAMMLNARDDLTQIIHNVSQQTEIQNIRIYNKNGEIKFSNLPSEVDSTTNIEAEACYICHRSDPPLQELGLEQRTRIFRAPGGQRLLGIITPIYNVPGCSTGACHFHSENKKVLGALDLVVSLASTDRKIITEERNILVFTAIVFLATSSVILIFLQRFINRPIRSLISETRAIARGNFSNTTAIRRKDEMGLLAHAVQRMGVEIHMQQAELNKQRNEYQHLFEQVPCLITVQDRNYRLLRYNGEFARRFAPRPGDFCYHAYKGRSEKCESCPVEKTFADGLSYYAEESGINKDGTQSYWIVRTSPIRDQNGKIIAAMEISHDITQRRQLEIDLGNSEKKYRAIFSNIPNPVFVLNPDNLTIQDCNDSVATVYGYDTRTMAGRSFMDLFFPEDRKTMAAELLTRREINLVRHMHKSGRKLFVNIRVSLLEHSGKKALLVTTSDITQRLEVEQQLIQAGKMATLGEMATGVAHELNQPLSVIKTASSFFVRKLADQAPIDPQILATMLGKIDANVDRATRIIQHMRLFASKSDIRLQNVHVNDVLASAFEIFSQQLKVRGINVEWKLYQNPPAVRADPQRLEQVFINLLLNARDAIEDKWEASGKAEQQDVIVIASQVENGRVVCSVCDSGTGISNCAQGKLFEPFFTTKEVGKGTGLGLSISYGIVKECHGTIGWRSNDGQGTCFEVSLPAAANGMDACV